MRILTAIYSSSGLRELILVTHEMRFARDVGTKLVFMHHGKVHEEGVPKEVFAAPRTAELQQFVGSIG